jgi:hypothetical protein
VNSEWHIPNLPSAPDEYEAAYFDRLIRSIENSLRHARSAGLLTAKNINISHLPTSSAGLRSGDLWYDSAASNVVKIVP